MKKFIFVIVISFLIMPSVVFAKGGLASEYISNLQDSNLVNDGTAQNNKRYIGTNPNNYVLFNNERSAISRTLYGISVTDSVGNSYDDEGACLNAVGGYIGVVFNHGATYNCVLNEETNKYDMHVTGTLSDEFITTAGGFDETSLDECNNFITNLGGDDAYSCVGRDVMFKGWRIIGVFDNNGQKRVKLVRNESIGTYSFDGTPNTINAGLGRNAWQASAMMKLLNPGFDSEIANGSLYWNSTSGICLRANGASGIDCDFSHNGLTDVGKNMIEDALWNTSFVDNNANGIELYNKERNGNTTIDVPQDATPSDGVDRVATWTGKVGLPSASDFALASTNCTENLIENGVSGCADNWLFNTDKPILTMTPNNSNLSKILVSDNDNTFTITDASIAGEIYPTVYLANDVYIIDGDGTLENPYILGKGKKEVNITLTLSPTTYYLSNYVTDIDPSTVNWDMSNNDVITLSNGTFVPKAAGQVKLDANVNGTYYVVNITINEVQMRIEDNVSTSNASTTLSDFNKIKNPKTSVNAEKLSVMKNDFKYDLFSFVMFLVVSSLSLFACFRTKRI